MFGKLITIKFSCFKLNSTHLNLIAETLHCHLQVSAARIAREDRAIDVKSPGYAVAALRAFDHLQITASDKRADGEELGIAVELDARRKDD